MPRFRSVSKTTNTVKLLVGDKMHIKDLVKEFRLTDKRFENETTAIRYFVHLGITAQTATENLRNSLDNTIVKTSIKEAVRMELSFHSAHIENLQNMVKYSVQRNEENFADIARRTEIIETKLDGGLNDLKSLLNNFITTGEISLRNLIVMRTIIYVYLLGIKTGRLETGDENLGKWTTMITYAHQQANELSLEEIKLLSSNIMETTVIQKMATEVFKKVSALPAPKSE